ncbi:MAG: hypothetical protein ACRCYB_06605 [Aeromonas veronii]
MNSRLARKIAAKEHNDRIALMEEMASIRARIYSKHGARVMVSYDNTNESVRIEIDRLKAIFESDAPPRRDVNGGRRDFARIHLAAIAAMAGIGHVENNRNRGQ